MRKPWISLWLGLGLVAAWAAAGCAVTGAALPRADDLPAGAATPLDGLWRLEPEGVVFRFAEGRISAAEPYTAGLVRVQEGQVLVRDFRQTGPRSFEGYDLFLKAPWSAELGDDGVLTSKAGIFVRSSQAMHLDDRPWLEAQLVSDTVLAHPPTTRRASTAAAAGGPAASALAAGIPDGVDPATFGRYHALVIGNDSYQHVETLRTARNDARAVARLLEDAYRMETTLLLDATREQILLAFSGLRGRLRAEDNLLIYYAGHGWLDEAADEGYWLPVDAERDNDVHWIANSTITAHFRAMPAKHVLVVADSCYSGTLTRGIRMKSPETPGDWQRLATRKARVVLTSGGEEPVEDGTGRHSAFAGAFLAALRDNRGVLDATSLYAHIRRPVMLSANQQPELSDIRKAGHEGGDFLFVRRLPAAP